jgi:hypothetical protein
MSPRPRTLVAAALVAAIAGAGGIAGATPFNAELTASKDSFLRKSPRNTNEGANEILVVRRTGRNRAVVGFDLTGIDTAG